MRNLSDVILKPVITEKAMDMISGKRYVFKVVKDANKAEIAKAVEAMFDVKVADVNTINMKKKPKRLGVHAGYTGEWKKAIVTLTEDSKTIAFFDSLN
ncbi:MAG: 50S ribosomal protein L23 [Ruminococcaceae bacterium]|nr:50S ribosomal protein L23 [Oscillospiraceae bacterium]